MKDACLAVVILAYNERVHIERVLQTAEKLGAPAFVVDSFSSDGTAELARRAGAYVAQRAFVNQAQQLQWALDNLPIAADWVLRLDADETLTPELIAEIRQRLPTLPPDVAGVNLRRRHIFFGRWIRHGGRYPLTLLRIWRRGAARVERRWMDEHMALTRGRTVTFAHDFADHNLGDLAAFIDKHNRYATREAIDVLTRRYDLCERDAALSSRSASRQAAAKRRLKEGFYNRLPFGTAALAYFLLRYFLLLGFLDGPEGLIYHVLQGFWYRFLAGAKVVELDRALRPLAGRERRLAALARLTGYEVSALKDEF